MASLSIGDVIDSTLPAPQGAPAVNFATDESLYLIDGTTAYPLVPDSIADDDLAALTLGSQIDAVVPRALWTETLTVDSPPTANVPASAAEANTVAPQPAAAPAVAVPSPSARAVAASLGAAPTTGCPTSVQSVPLVPPDAVPITGTADLTGEAHNVGASPPPLIAVGATITSAVGGTPGPGILHDDFAIALSCRTKYKFSFSSSNSYGHGPLIMMVTGPGPYANTMVPGLATIEVHFQLTATALEHYGDCWVVASHDFSGNTFTNFDCTYTPTITGIYLLTTTAQARDPGHSPDEPQRYTFQITPV